MIDHLICRSVAERKSRLPVLLSAVLLVLGFAVRIAFPRTGWGALLAFCGGAAVTAGLYLAVRYLARRYIYTLEQMTDGRIDLAVQEQNFLRQTTVCRISIDQICSLSEAKKTKRPRGSRIYHYCADIRPKNAILLTVIESNGETAHIRFTPDEAFRNTLSLFIPSKKDGEIFDGFGKNP